jgi:hypothetical protein
VCCGGSNTAPIFDMIKTIKIDEDPDPLEGLRPLNDDTFVRTGSGGKSPRRNSSA